jgi:hypothetical protein
MPPHWKRLLPDHEEKEEEDRKPLLVFTAAPLASSSAAASASGPAGGQGSQGSSNNGSTTANNNNGSSSASASASSSPSRALARPRPRRQQDDDDGQQGRDGNGNGNGDGGGDDVPWAPAEEMRYWAVSRTLRLAVLVAFLGLVQALLSAEAIFWLVLCLASLSSLAAMGYARVRERGLLGYLPPATQQMLLETSLLDWLMDTSMADRMKPYMALGFGGLNAEERAFLVSSLPREQQQALVAPGLLYALPAVRDLDCMIWIVFV